MIVMLDYYSINNDGLMFFSYLKILNPKELLAF